MKILFFSHYNGLLGSNRSLASLLFHFHQRGVDVEVMLPFRGEFYRYLESNGFRVHAFPFIYEALYVKRNKKYLSLPLLWVYNLLAMPFLLWKIRRIGPDMVYTNSSSDLYTGFMTRLLNVRHVMHVREFMEEDFGAHCIFGRRVKRNILLKSNKLVFVSQAVAQSVTGGVPDNGRVIYNGLPMPKTEPLMPMLDGHLRIGVVGNIDISKQQHLAISMMPEILKKYPDVSLHLIGDKECEYKQQLKRMVVELGLTDKVIFEGFIKDVETIYSKCDVLLMCSRSEAFGRVTIEAMLRNKPVIGFDSGGTSELIDDGKTGFKFRETEDVIKALDIIINDPTRAAAIIDAARTTAQRRFSEERYTKDVYDFVMS